ncbi:hypothetical protein [Vibrio phage JSF12]|uniref:Uncharacterized protein n=2 Tax=Jesfedecavirus TaxID=2560156 RepID=A0A2D0YNE8_9CAUD|nr:hypothetical protein FDI98_gp130 [Vibrio phage JSF10]YP_009794710.1 hypothetical protein HOS35_gp027 [Vibrio phage JSF12]ASV43402.1 hypothetical protein [Vibrio phage JSF10]ASV43545.1 hypothetical protein [Vibrio phage JSF12]
MLKHKEAIFQCIVEALDGTCITLDTGIHAGAFNFVADKLGDDWYQYSDIIEEFGNEVYACINESLQLCEELEEFISQSIAICPVCGWWAECYEDSDDYDECICSDCAS